MKKKYPERFYDNPFTLAPCSDCKYRIGNSLACQAYKDGLNGDIVLKVLEHPDEECKEGFKYTPKE